MRNVIAGGVAVLVLVALWPGVCAAGDCASAFGVPLPWVSHIPDYVSMGGASLAALIVFVIVLARLRRPAP